ncbi:MAG: N-acetylmuramoyl-L-alanine amidase [Mobilitalea sp.]
MDKTLLKKAAFQSVALMIAVITLSYALKYYQMVTVSANNSPHEEEMMVGDANEDTDNKIDVPVEQVDPDLNPVEITDVTVSDLKSLEKFIDQSVLQQLSSDYIAIQKPQQKGSSITLEDLYISHSIRLKFSGLSQDDISANSIFRVRNNELYKGEPKYTEEKTIEEDDGELKEVIARDYGKDISHGITITTQANKEKGQSTEVLIDLDTVYAYTIYEDKNFYYIDLKKPSEAYDKILVIDAGHGGKDAGALSKGSKYLEKDVNLDILLYLQKLLEKEDIKVYYTRNEDETVFLNPRVNLANAVNCDYFISIHCNANTVSSPNGTEVLYYDQESKGVKNHDLAVVFSDEIGKLLPLRQRGLIKKHPEDIYIMDKALVPTVLIEVGYMTNNTDMNYLSKAENRKTVAEGIYNAIMRAYSEMPPTE